jgi:hypothetical protein
VLEAASSLEGNVVAFGQGSPLRSVPDVEKELRRRLRELAQLAYVKPPGKVLDNVLHLRELGGLDSIPRFLLDERC